MRANIGFGEYLKSMSLQKWIQITTSCSTFCGKSNSKKEIPTEINDKNGVKLSDLKDIANSFNKYYVNVGPELARKIGPTKKDFTAYTPVTFKSD